MSAVDAASARSSPAPRACSDCDATASVTSDLHKVRHGHVACPLTEREPTFTELGTEARCLTCHLLLAQLLSDIYSTWMTELR
ncbi:hypothetical protein EVAR_94604_1 [Eumeta japonica]|uniref:Uncharacterized protein n=1 Tax=Eumeta variegata TaxID=151549 RepID=A0A4C1UVF0_EUMVA|nr:hypothetical protein EVAR_94604_1 [Eumeta japonica]